MTLFTNVKQPSVCDKKKEQKQAGHTNPFLKAELNRVKNVKQLYVNNFIHKQIKHITYFPNSAFSDCLKKAIFNIVGKNKQF